MMLTTLKQQLFNQHLQRNEKSYFFKKNVFRFENYCGGSGAIGSAHCSENPSMEQLDSERALLIALE